jgi:hypothetical protein
MAPGPSESPSAPGIDDARSETLEGGIIGGFTLSYAEAALQNDGVAQAVGGGNGKDVPSAFPSKNAADAGGDKPFAWNFDPDPETFFDKHCLPPEKDEDGCLLSDSLIVLSGDNPVRIVLLVAIRSAVFEAFIVLCIVVNCVFIALDDPLAAEQPAYIDIADPKWC